MLISCMSYIIETNNLTYVSVVTDKPVTGRATDRATEDTTWAVDEITFHFVNGEKLVVDDPSLKFMEMFECGEVVIQGR